MSRVRSKNHGVPSMNPQFRVLLTRFVGSSEAAAHCCSEDNAGARDQWRSPILVQDSQIRTGGVLGWDSRIGVRIPLPPPSCEIYNIFPAQRACLRPIPPTEENVDVRTPP